MNMYTLEQKKQYERDNMENMYREEKYCIGRFVGKNEHRRKTRERKARKCILDL